MNDNVKLTTEEQQAFDLFGTDPIHIDSVFEAIDGERQVVASTLVMLELKGKLYQLPGKKYRKSFDSLADDFIGSKAPSRKLVKAMITAASPQVVDVRVYTDGRISVKEHRGDRRGLLLKNLGNRFSKATAIKNNDMDAIHYELDKVMTKNPYVHTLLRFFTFTEAIGYPE